MGLACFGPYPLSLSAVVFLQLLQLFLHTPPFFRFLGSRRRRIFGFGMLCLGSRSGNNNQSRLSPTLRRRPCCPCVIPGVVVSLGLIAGRSLIFCSPWPPLQVHYLGRSFPSLGQRSATWTRARPIIGLVVIPCAFCPQPIGRTAHRTTSLLRRTGFARHGG